MLEHEKAPFPAGGGMVVDPSGTQAAGGGASDPGGGGFAKPQFSRHLRRAMAALRNAGFEVDPDSGKATMANAAGDATAGPSSGMEGGGGFCETVARSGVTGIVETANALGSQFVKGKAADVLGEPDAQRFADKAKMTPAVREGLINNGVEVCRINNVNLPPEAALAALGLGWLYGLFSITEELKKLQAMKGGQSEPPPDAS